MSELDSKLRIDYDKLSKPARYGTAGFRDLAVNMPYISFRVGVFVSILNKTKPEMSLGVVISASHNKIQDNGVKITNFKGNMLERAYEEVLEKFVQEKDLKKAVISFKEYLTDRQKKVVFEDKNVNVFIGGDTRPSTTQLLELVSKGIQYVNGTAINFGLTTTPQLQYYVYFYNTFLIAQAINPESLRQKYWINFSSYYRRCMEYLKCTQLKYRCLDCSNGVGGKIILHFQEQLKDLIQLQLINNTHPELLNYKCGADFIKVEKTFPSQYQQKNHNCFVSFDGDADRIVEFVEKEKQLMLIDGDRQGTIFTKFYKRITEELNEKTQKLSQLYHIDVVAPCKPTIGFVQTFYANYSSSEYLYKNYQMNPIYTATGVKFLHQKAEQFDIGVYFEANGHGTVIFRQQFLGKIENLLHSKVTTLQSQIVKKNQNAKKAIESYFEFVQFYQNACKLANPSVGDAICNFLIFQLALTYLKLTYEDTFQLYTDLKSKTLKIAVKSKENLKTTDIEDKVTSPIGLQEQIDQIVKKHDGRKAFLRPSGTQNVLRLHVEAKTMEQVEQITKQINKIVSNHQQLN